MILVYVTVSVPCMCMNMMILPGFDGHIGSVPGQSCSNHRERKPSPLPLKMLCFNQHITCQTENLNIPNPNFVVIFTPQNHCLNPWIMHDILKLWHSFFHTNYACATCSQAYSLKFADKTLNTVLQG